MSLEKKPRKAVAKKGVTKKTVDVRSESPALETTVGVSSVPTVPTTAVLTPVARTTETRGTATKPTRKIGAKFFQVNVEDLIRLRAYEIYLRRGGTPGNQHEDWQLAEREVREHFNAQLGQEADA